jgi:hypothetical protein
MQLSATVEGMDITHRQATGDRPGNTPDGQ